MTAATHPVDGQQGGGLGHAVRNPAGRPPNRGSLHRMNGHAGGQGCVAGIDHLITGIGAGMACCDVVAPQASAASTLASRRSLPYLELSESARGLEKHAPRRPAETPSGYDA
jgi:hypothetical protein